MSLSHSPKIVTNGLVLCLDAADKKSYPGTGNTWFDRSGNGNNGALTNGPTFSSSNGGNIVFDGSNDYINNPLTKTINCTFSCWARINVLNNAMLFNAGINGLGPDLFFYNGFISWNTWDGDVNKFSTIPASAINGNFHHYVVVNDSATNAKLYYDGNLLGTAIYKNAAGNTNLTIGGNIDSFQWNGSISNFLVYNKLLTPQEILQNFNATRGRYGI
jgi:hypothetical protein